MKFDMNLDEKVQFLKALEEREGRRAARAARLSWISVAAAALVFVFLIAVAGSALRRVRFELSTNQTELTAREGELNELQRTLDLRKNEIAELERTRAEKQRAIQGLQSILDTLPQTTRQQLVRETLSRNPSTAALLPRLYLHIVQPGDRGFAEQMAERLRDAGYFVVGIQLLRTDLKVTDVRYYRRSEEEAANRIVEVLRRAGETNVRANFLQQYANTKGARPNHFEIWFARREAPAAR